MRMRGVCCLSQAGAEGVGGDVLVDIECERERGPAGLTGYAGRGAVADGMEEVLKLKAKWLAFEDVGLVEREAQGRVRSGAGGSDGRGGGE